MYTFFTGTDNRRRNNQKEPSRATISWGGKNYWNLNRLQEQLTTGTRARKGAVTTDTVTGTGTIKNRNQNRIQGTRETRMKLLAFISFHR